MAEYDNTNTFTLFKNDKGDNPKRPDYTGNLNIDGIEFRISGWIREGQKSKFISGTAQLKEVNSEAKREVAKENEDVPF
ncbi:hypothetical protein EB001_22145 [bacterium]|nr:hypothetical protein [bacterium]